MYTLMRKNLIHCPAIVYIQGEEMTRHVMKTFVDKCIQPHVDTSSWDFFDMSCKNRDKTKDKVLHDAILRGNEVCSIFKEPTVTPSLIQKEKYNLSMDLKSPNGAMRNAWNGFTISRDTIHIDGIPLGYENPIYFERHAIGGEYNAGWKVVGPGKVKTLFWEPGQWIPTIVDERHLHNCVNAVVTYDNPLDNVDDLAHHFFTRCLEAKLSPYVITKKTVFKWQEPFWKRMKDIFDKHYKEKYIQKGLLAHNELEHIISDAATMKLIQWKKGGFGMVAHNYDADMLTDEMAQVHKSPGLITSNLIGRSSNGTLLKQFEASHGTATDLWEKHLQGEETSLNPLGLMEALLGSMDYAEQLRGEKKEIQMFNHQVRQKAHQLYRNGCGTIDICGHGGCSTEEFIDLLSMELTT